MPAGRRPIRPVELVITCEHGGNRIPAAYRRAFAHAGHALQSHRGYDPGALLLAREFARKLHAALVFSTTSRLLVELNRSPGHRNQFSTYSRRLPAEVRNEIVRRYYEPYRKAVEAEVLRGVRRGRQVVHLSCHSFTPRLAGVVRHTDVGLLFDPHRPSEAKLCRRWQTDLLPHVRVRRNYPYRGWADGLTTYLRTRFPDRAYVGIELEVNQNFPRGDPARWRWLRRVLVETLDHNLARSPSHVHLVLEPHHRRARQMP